MLPIFRTRLALALIACVVVALELTLMRGLAVRFSSHFAGIVISVGLLGFGAAGSFLTLLRGAVLRNQRVLLVLLALALSEAVPFTWWKSQQVPLNINFLAWSFSEAPHVLRIELLMLLPFALAGAFIGIVLMDAPDRISGHYAADLFGSGVGGIAAVLAMNFLSIVQLLVVISAASVVAALLLISWKKPAQVFLAGGMVALAGLLLAIMPREPAPNPYKPLTLAKLFAGTEVIYHDEGPLGRIDVVTGPRLHAAPQLSLQYFDDLPPHAELYVDGDGPSLIYDCKTTEDWNFANYRTAAAGYIFRPTNALPKVCIIGAGGGIEIGTALINHSTDITALELNPQIIRAMTGPLADRGGKVYRAAGVHILNQEARGFFAATSVMFDIIQFPPVGGFGAAGSDATQESYYYTTESLRAMWSHLSPTGILVMTRGINTPPREELRAFDLAAESLRQEKIDPATHLAMIRGSFSCTILVSKSSIEPAQIAALQAFCQKTGFDPCYFPGLTDAQANPVLDLHSSSPQYGSYNLVDHPYYFTGPQAMVGTPEQRSKFLADYLFELSPPTDNQPYFFHTFRWSSYATLKERYGQGSHAFLEVSYIMLLVALSQAVVLAVIFIILPLVPGIQTLGKCRQKGASLGYFLMIGLGFMLLEMGFVQKLVLYLAHPIYAAAVVISSFLVFAGLGSHFSKRWRADAGRVVLVSVVGITLFGLGFLLALDAWLALSESWPVIMRSVVAAFTIAPLAFVMGQLFPLGLLRTAEYQPVLVPWCWAINGFASVLSTSAAPILAMYFGFNWLVIVAISCYILACVLFNRMRLTDTVSTLQG